MNVGAMSWCYSPAPPEAYTRAGLGHGKWAETLPQWNLAWLSFPALDLYIETSTPLIEIIGSIDSELFGLVVGAADMHSDDLFPGLNSALKQHPRNFAAKVLNGPWEAFDVYDLLGEEWVATMRKRALMAVAANMAAIEGKMAFSDDPTVLEAEAVITRVTGNVTYAEFRKRLDR
jgi:hypothetical protein